MALGYPAASQRRFVSPKCNDGHTDSTELAANLFRAMQTGKKIVRRTIHELGGTMPEILPVAEGFTIVRPTCP